MSIVLKGTHSVVFQVSLHRPEEVLAIAFVARISSKDLCVIEKVGALFWGIWVLMGVLGVAVDHSKLIDIIFSQLGRLIGLPCAYLGSCVIEGVSLSTVGACLSHHLIICLCAHRAIFQSLSRPAALRSHLPSTACLTTAPTI